MKKESITFYFNEFDTLLIKANRLKLEKYLFGVLTVIAIVIFYFRKDELKLDIINCISIYVVFQFLLSSILFIKTTNKIKEESEEFVKNGLFDECDQETKRIYNNYINDANKLIKK